MSILVLNASMRGGKKMETVGVFCIGKNKVVKTTHSNSEMVLQTIKIQ
jgi:hypothetical protein